jgi:hypothetical protein
MATTPSFNFEVKKLTVTLTFGSLSGEKTFASKEGLEAARTVYESTLKAMKAKKSTASLKAELFTIFDIGKTVSVEVTNDAPKTEKPKKEKAAKEVAEEPVQEKGVPTNRIQVGKTVTVFVDGEKLTKVFDDKDEREAGKTIYNKIKDIESKEKWSKTDVMTIIKLKSQLKESMFSNTIKEEKAVKAVAEKTKAIDKKLAKLSVKLVTPNKNLIEALTVEHKLSAEDVDKINAIIEKKKVEAPVATVTRTPRRGEH